MSLEYPEPQDFTEFENELVPGRIIGSFQSYPAEAFRASTIVRTFRVDFANPNVGSLKDIVSQKLGYAAMEAGTGNILRHLPEVDFYFDHLVAARVDLSTMSYQGLDPDSDPETKPPLASSNLYKYLIAQVHYSYPRFRIGDRDEDTSQIGAPPEFETDRFCTKEVRGAVSFFTGKPGSFVWDASSGLTSPNNQILFQIPQILPKEDLLVWWLGVPLDAFPLSAIARCRGKINAIDLELPEVPPPKTYAAESIGLETYSYIDDAFPNGDKCVHICYHFKHKPAQITTDNGTIVDTFGFNGLLYPGTATFYRVKRAGAGDFSSSTYVGLFETADFHDLFRPEPA